MTRLSGVQELERETLDFRWGYHNCISGSSKAEVLYGVMRDAGLGPDLRKTGSPTSEFIDRLREGPWGDSPILSR